MAEFNRDPRHIHMIVEQTKRFLDKQIDKYPTLKELRAQGDKFIILAFEIVEENNYINLRKTKSGRDLIDAFLNATRNSGSYKKWEIREALKVLKGRQRRSGR